MASLWGVTSSTSTSPNYSGQWKRVGTIPNPCIQAQPATVDVEPTCDPAHRKQCLPNQFMGYWNGLDSGKLTSTHQRSPSKRHYDLPGDGEPTTKRLLSERMAAGMRKLYISEDQPYGKSSTEHSVPSNGLWKDERVFGAGINFGSDPWMQEIDNRLDAKIDSDESGNEDDHPRLIIKQDFLNVFKSQNVEPSLPPQILSDM
ncbi:uncharacterized protein LOC117105331 [Anneissia japonica]|uniref:uncharacterized protein LOC117105331 n=1 Tax=Anneissia japonica TaxID=1529436 RepID=UPI001425850A|nr:uncharacterized protein LOC117105331 [Anneissia japonica]